MLCYISHEYRTLTDSIAPPPPSPEELAAQEAAAQKTIFNMLSMCVVLYFCMPHLSDLVPNGKRGLIPSTAPFAVDAVKMLI